MSVTNFYQAGSRAAGNRLLGPGEQILADPARASSPTSGHRAGQGGGAAFGARHVLDTAMRVTGGQLVVVNATGCLELFSTPYPESSQPVAWLHSLSGNAPAVATGVAAALRAKGDTTTRVLGQAGDDGTVDIGMGCLSGMFERDDDVLFVCYDNEAYPHKDVARIARAHRIPYVATATVADLPDLAAKVAKAMSLRGARYLHVLVPCPLGGGTAAGDTITVARSATQCGLFPVYQAEYGDVVSVSPIRHRIPVEEHLRPQARYAHLFTPERRADIIDTLQTVADRNIAEFGLAVGSRPAEQT